jgi:hypothetical protein
VNDAIWKIKHTVDYEPPSNPEHLVELRSRLERTLQRHGLTGDVRDRIKSRVIRAVEYPAYGNGISAEHIGRGRPPDYGSQLLASEIRQIFLEEGLSGNSLRSDDDKIGVVAEVEAIAQTARKVVWGIPHAQGVSARPARITAAQASVGPVKRLPTLTDD